MPEFSRRWQRWVTWLTWLVMIAWTSGYVLAPEDSVQSSRLITNTGALTWPSRYFATIPGMNSCIFLELNVYVVEIKHLSFFSRHFQHFKGYWAMERGQIHGKSCLQVCAQVPRSLPGTYPTCGDNHSMGNCDGFHGKRISSVPADVPVWPATMAPGLPHSPSNSSGDELSAFTGTYASRPASE